MVAFPVLAAVAADVVAEVVMGHSSVRYGWGGVVTRPRRGR
jgi:hypothetical protein